MKFSANTWKNIKIILVFGFLLWPGKYATFSMNFSSFEFYSNFRMQMLLPHFEAKETKSQEETKSPA